MRLFPGSSGDHLVAKSQDIAGLGLLQRTQWVERTFACNLIFLALKKMFLALIHAPIFLFSLEVL